MEARSVFLYFTVLFRRPQTARYWWDRPLSRLSALATLAGVVLLLANLTGSEAWFYAGFAVAGVGFLGWSAALWGYLEEKRRLR